MPTRRALLKVIDVPAIEAAIARAEQRTSGEIRVSIAPWFWGRARRAAELAFERLGVHATRERNGVLIFVAPARRRVVVLGDQGIHARVGQACWDALVREVGEAFHAGRYADGLIHAIDTLGERLAEHFPSVPDDNPDELPNSLDWGPPPIPTHSPAAHPPKKPV